MAVNLRLSGFWMWVSVLLIAGTFHPNVTPLQVRRPPQGASMHSPANFQQSMPQNMNGSSLCYNGTLNNNCDHTTSPVVSNQSAEEIGFLSCSTTVRVLPARIHNCPDGYRCQIYESGDPVTGKPNKGMCNKVLTPHEADYGDESFELRELSTVYLPGGCLLTSTEYTDLESFLHGGHYSSCKCEKGAVLCKVPFNRNFIESDKEKIDAGIVSLNREAKAVLTVL